MLTVNLTIESKKRRWLDRFRRRRFVLHLPEFWEEVQPLRRRQRWWRWVMALPRPAAQRAMVRDLLPRHFRRILSDLDMAALAMQLDWTGGDPQCDQVPIPHTTHVGRMYHFPTAKGENTTCIEYALADDYYKQFADGDAEALFRLSATLWRESDHDADAALRRGDKRVPLCDKAEVEKRAAVLREAPAEIHLQALHFFGGLKKYIHRVYGNWLFEQPEEDEEGEAASADAKAGSPDFGWWGVFQQVAEAGVFGHDVRQVYQAPLHEVCVYLVRKRVQEQQMNSQMPAPPRQNDYDD